MTLCAVLFALGPANLYGGQILHSCCQLQKSNSTVSFESKHPVAGSLQGRLEWRGKPQEPHPCAWLTHPSTAPSSPSSLRMHSGSAQHVHHPFPGSALHSLRQAQVARTSPPCILRQGRQHIELGWPAVPEHPRVCTHGPRNA